MEIDGFDENSPSVDEAPAVEESGNILFPEEFQVDDLLDLGGLPEPEDGDEGEDDASKGLVFVALDKEKAFHLSEISLPEETEAANLEWLSRFVDDCHSEYPPALASMAHKHTAFFLKKQPSLLSTAAVACSFKKEVLIPVKAKRSKRLRRVGAFWSLSGTSPASSITTAVLPSLSPSSSSSSSIFNEPKQFPVKMHVPKKRGRKPKISTARCASGDRRCTHCGVQKTPQWRAGPHGSKTLCNACGVRFKSGRLLPEYRPACSPTFVRSIHSNNHRKVLEMRRKKDVQLFSASAPPVHSC